MITEHFWTDYSTQYQIKQRFPLKEVGNFLEPTQTYFGNLIPVLPNITCFVLTFLKFLKRLNVIQF